MTPYSVSNSSAGSHLAFGREAEPFDGSLLDVRRLQYVSIVAWMDTVQELLGLLSGSRRW